MKKEPAFFACTEAERLALLRQQLNRAAACCFYADRLPDGRTFRSLMDVSSLPFLTDNDIRAYGKAMCCVGAGEIRRIVSLRSSGTTGEMKRLFFTEGDLERSVRFFAEGMRLLCSAGESVGVLFPCDTPDGLGDLLCRGLASFGAKPLPLDTGEKSLGELCGALSASGPDVLVGIPRMLRMAAVMLPKLCPRVVLLSGDYVSRSLRKLLTETWGCTVCEHYGLTETGYGCAVEDADHRGMLLRRDELYLETVDENGDSVADGCAGEIVLTTLRREAMPLIRYRTGDVGIMSRGRLLRALGRKTDAYAPMLAEALDGNRDILDYSLTRCGDRGILHIFGMGNADTSDAFSHILPGLTISAEWENIQAPEAFSLQREKRRTLYSV